MTEHVDAQEVMARFRAAAEAGSIPAAVDALIAELHPADLAEIIDALDPDERVTFFRRIPADLRAETLTEVGEGAWPALLEGVHAADIRDLFGDLDLDDAADILAELPSEDARQILEGIEPEESREIAALMRYDEESAGGVMTTELVSVPEDLAADEAIVAVRNRGREVRDFNTVYVVDGEQRLVGIVALRELILAEGRSRVSDIMERDLVAVHPTEDQEQVARLIAKYNLISIPVVDESGRLLGRITHDDVIDILEAETTEDLFRLSGVHEEEEVHASAADIVRSRAPWLMITLGTSGLGALVVAQFESTIQRLAFLAVFMPVVAAMAGNSAIQATTVAVRRLALAGRPTRTARSLSREVAAGVVIGGIVGVLLGICGGIWQESVRVGVVVGASMWLAIILGASWGAAFPLLLDRLGLDPAVSSSVFLTTMTDMLSFLLILGSATYFLVRLL